jgi:hypothetical protein
MFKIVQKKNPHALYASGFVTRARAETWLDNYDPKMWMDKTIQAKDLEIVEENTDTSSRRR